VTVPDVVVLADVLRGRGAVNLDGAVDVVDVDEALLGDDVEFPDLPLVSLLAVSSAMTSDPNCSVAVACRLPLTPAPVIDVGDSPTMASTMSMS
jgi:hypothetical protein